MKPKNFPDRVERRRRVALRALQAFIEITPGHMVSKRKAHEYATLQNACSSRKLLPRDIRLRAKAGDRRKPGKYTGARP